MRSPIAAAVVLLALWVVAPNTLWAEPSGDDPDAPSEGGVAPSTASTSGSVGGEIDVRVAQFGVGGAARVGDWFAMRVELQDNSPKIRNVVVRLSITDADGDITFYQRAALPNPGIWQSVWMYARLPFGQNGSSPLRLTVHEAIERGGSGTDSSAPGDALGEGTGAAGPSRFEAGRVLGITQYPINSVLPPHVAAFAVVGDRAAGLEQYATNRVSGSGYENPPPTGHEIVSVVRISDINELPDRWQGLGEFQVLAWTTASKMQPSQLLEPQAQAIREWVRRGGHLVVVLPPVGQGWVGSGSVGNPLADIMPTVSIRRVEGVDLEPFRDLLTDLPSVKLPRAATVQYLVPNSNTDGYSAMPILNSPGEKGPGTGEPVVVRRLLGTGAVTLVGMDVASPSVSDVSGALRGHVFWGRILGKRLETLTPSEIAARAASNSNSPFFARPSQALTLDAAVKPAIAMSAQSAAGLLMAFVVFLAYWLLAGPVGFFGLKAKGRRQHAWLAFFGATIVFTGIAWGGATLLKGRRVTIKHLTVIDHIYGQSNQRARAWLNIYFPNYGNVDVGVPGGTGGTGNEGAFQNLLAAWESSESSGSGQAFPDARGYVVSARAPSLMPTPVRATAKQFQADWAGVLPPDWRMPLPEATVDASGRQAPFGEEITLTHRPDTPAGLWPWRLQGVLTHNLPADLTDVLVLVNTGLVARRGPGDRAFSDCYAVQYPDPWKPGEKLDLADKRMFATDIKAAKFKFEEWLKARQSMRYRDLSALPPGTAEQWQYLVDSSFLSLFGLYERQGPNLQAAAIKTELLSTYDLSRWFTQPCVMIVGRLDNVSCPVPMTVNGEPVPVGTSRNSGPVLVRWVYPLRPRPPTDESRAEPANERPAEGGASRDGEEAGDAGALPGS